MDTENMDDGVHLEHMGTVDDVLANARRRRHLEDSDRLRVFLKPYFGVEHGRIMRLLPLLGNPLLLQPGQDLLGVVIRVVGDDDAHASGGPGARDRGDEVLGAKVEEGPVEVGSRMLAKRYPHEGIDRVGLRGWVAYVHSSPFFGRGVGTMAGHACAARLMTLSFGDSPVRSDSPVTTTSAGGSVGVDGRNVITSP
jgi:hypothetical protein